MIELCQCPACEFMKYYELKGSDESMCSLINSQLTEKEKEEYKIYYYQLQLAHLRGLTKNAQ